MSLPNSTTDLITMEQADRFANAVTFDVKELKRAIATLKGVVEAKSKIPILSGVLIDAKSGNATITGTDLEVGAVVRLKARGAARVVVTLRELEASLKSAKSGSVRLFPSEAWRVGVALDGGCSMLSGFDLASYPDLPAVPAVPAAFTVTASTLRPILAEVVPCISVEKSRFTLNGAKLVAMPKLGIIRMVATDGHRLAYRDWDQACGEFDALVPKPALEFMGKMDGTLEFRSDEHHVFVSNGEVTLMARRLAGNFPDYIRVIPNTDDGYKRATIQRTGLLQALEGAYAFLKTGKPRNFPVDVKLNGKAVVTARLDADKAYGAAALGSWSGPTDTMVKLDARYLIDALKGLPAETVSISVRPKVLESGEVVTENAIVIHASGVVRGNTVIMPMRA